MECVCIECAHQHTPLFHNSIALQHWVGQQSVLGRKASCCLYRLYMATPWFCVRAPVQKPMLLPPQAANIRMQLSVGCCSDCGSNDSTGEQPSHTLSNLIGHPPPLLPPLPSPPLPFLPPRPPPPPQSPTHPCPTTWCSNSRRRPPYSLPHNLHKVHVTHLFVSYSSAPNGVRRMCRNREAAIGSARLRSLTRPLGFIVTADRANCKHIVRTVPVVGRCACSLLRLQ